MEVTALRKFLLKLSKGLTDDEVDDVKFLIGLPDGTAERIKRPVDLFKEILKQNTAEEHVIRCLQDLFDSLDRNDLVEKLSNYVEERKIQESDLAKSCSLPAQEPSGSGFGNLPRSFEDHNQSERVYPASAPNSPPEDRNAEPLSLKDERRSLPLYSQVQTSSPSSELPAAVNCFENSGQSGWRSQSETRVLLEDKCNSENTFHAKDRSQSVNRQSRSHDQPRNREYQALGRHGSDLENASVSNYTTKKEFVGCERELSFDLEKSGDDNHKSVEQFENTAFGTGGKLSSRESGHEKAKQGKDNLSCPVGFPALPRNDSETKLKELCVNDLARRSHDSLSIKQSMQRNTNETELKQAYDDNCISQASDPRSATEQNSISGENSDTLPFLLAVSIEALHVAGDVDSDGPTSASKSASNLKQSKNSSQIAQNFDLSQYLHRPESSVDHDHLRKCLPQLFSSEKNSSPAISGGSNRDLELLYQLDRNAVSAEYIEAQMLGENHTHSSNIIDKLLSKNRPRKASEPIHLRKYQKELAMPGTQGRNSIICAPTGSGKTLTAGYICQHHRMNAAIERRPFKTLFIVCIRNLVMQQRGALSQIVVDEDGGEAVGALSETALLSEYIKKFDVVVLTAQILVNCLKNNEVRLSDINLLIMDECHHTTQNHPYSVIMLEYHQFRRSNSPGKLPQVIGLTASLGVGSAGDSQSGALCHYIRLCANLDCSSVTHVRNKEHLDELLHFNPKPKKDQIIAVEPRSSADGLYEILGVMISEIEQITLFPLAKTSVSPGSQQYENWIVLQRLEAEAKGLLDTVTCTETLQRLNGALMLYDELRARDAKSYLDSFFVENFTLPSRRPTFLAIKQLYVDVRSKMDAVVQKERVCDNPKLDRLCTLLTDLYTSNNEAKGIILTRTRLSVEVLLNCIKELAELKGLVYPLKLTGQGGKEGRMTDVEQENTLRCFQLERERSSSCNLLIATDVAQEGLDMPKCNFVIRYNFVSNEIGSVQSKGRARAPNSECYLIVERNSVNEKREIQNLEKEHMMLQALEDIDTVEEENLVEAIRIEQVRILGEHEAKMQEKKSVARLLNAENVTIHCRSCKSELCQATDMRLRMNNYICIADDRLLKKIFIRKLGRPDEYRFDSKIGLCLCTSCEKIVGSQLQYKQGTRTYGYILSKNNVMWKYGEEEIYRQIKKWSAVPFEIREEAMFPGM